MSMCISALSGVVDASHGIGECGNRASSGALGLHEALPRESSDNTFERMKKRKKRLTNSEHRELSMSAVLAAAEFLFVTQGYNGTTTEQIGQLADLTKGSVYFYYGNKEGVLLELLNRVRANVMEPYLQILQDQSLSPVERMTKYLERAGEVALDHPGSMLLPIVVSIEMAATESEAARRVKAGYNRIAREVRTVLELGQASGMFRSDLSSSDMARVLISTGDGIMLECLRQNLRIDVHRLVRALKAVVLTGLQIASEAPRDIEADDGPSVIDVLRGNLQDHA
ncbi:TetR/AcrR family transcriptional regulator [Bradyrhizobium sp. SHOUNA76]|uniref:TetR/AcrR family transcriptional regulator n=2 Tax=unclassified Bradyrhizobium TaxID=2631580 RepID=UPI001FF597CB|nr:TetR/AcrR family transcriptional regulator [Bradyrhizobium sp. SHOUNA76]MCJ9699885.1 TetR/AcrR family transcriptional regulator [Bradyrhizobium sp. SHOUNA76]